MSGDKESKQASKRIAIASDHAAFDLKQQIVAHLKETGFAPEDFGVYENISVDYPDYGVKVAKAVGDGDFDRGILLCGTGIGMSITANKLPGVRATLVYDNYTARMSRLHNDSNVLVLGGRTTGISVALDIVDTWLTTEYEGGRHDRRLKKISDLENNRE
ncbi:MAG: ribose 5-phosphate isomerase B [Nitrospinae bacterium]|nr:ribose 5-phosphate isomerase B [Nitrospinota bacterium]